MAQVPDSDPFNFEYENIENLPGGDHVRLLTLAANNNPTEPIRASLSTTNLASQASYEALSYCWGSVNDKSLLFCDGKPFPVTENLASALRHLRHTHEDRVLWIDAVCINQKDISERAHQVSLMRRIYKNASRVVVWLGNANADSCTVFPLCERMVETRLDLLSDDTVDFHQAELLWGPNKKKVLGQKLREARQRKAAAKIDEKNQRLRNSDGGGIADSKPPAVLEPNGSFSEKSSTESDEIEVADATSEEAAAFLRLLERPWFTRCWVLQEVCLGREVIIMSGSSTIDWDHFYAGFSLAVLLGQRALAGRPEQLLRGGLVLMMLLRTHIQHPDDYAHMQQNDLSWLLWQTRNLHATDPRDKVYAVLGLLDPDEAKTLGLVADYSISVEECYKRASMAIMSSTKSLDILLTDRNLVSSLSSPSWVPDWTFIKPPTPAAIIRDSDRNTFKEPQFKPFCASTEMQWDSAGRVRGNSIELSGYVWDRVIELEDVLTVPQLNHVAIDDMTSSMGAFKGFWKPLLTGLGSYFDTLVKWEKLAFSWKHPRYPTGEDPKTAFAITMCAGNIDGPESALDGYKKWRKTLRGPKMMSPLKGIGASGGVYKSLVAAAGMITGVSNFKDRTYATATERTLYRRLARTEKEYIAIVPGHSIVGDQIALFEGGKMPFVTRLLPGTKQRELIGASYVHGIMHGEAWDKSLVTDVEIV